MDAITMQNMPMASYDHVLHIFTWGDDLIPTFLCGLQLKFLPQGLMERKQVTRDLYSCI